MKRLSDLNEHEENELLQSLMYTIVILILIIMFKGYGYI
jgi:hypothetical protein